MQIDCIILMLTEVTFYPVYRYNKLMKNSKAETKVSKQLEIIGWYGPIAFIIGFALVSFGVVEGRSYVFQLLNLTGGVALALISFEKKAYQPAVLNIILAIIAIVTLVDLIFGVSG